MEKSSNGSCGCMSGFFFSSKNLFSASLIETLPHTEKNLFLLSAGEDSEKLTCVLFFHELRIGNCLKLNFGPPTIQLGSWA